MNWGSSNLFAYSAVSAAALFAAVSLANAGLFAPAVWAALFGIQHAVSAVRTILVLKRARLLTILKTVRLGLALLLVSWSALFLGSLALAAVAEARSDEHRALIYGLVGLASAPMALFVIYQARRDIRNLSALIAKDPRTAPPAAAS